MFLQKTLEIVSNAETEIFELFRQLDLLCMENSSRVISAFIREGVESRHFNPTTGYGYSDEGREKLSNLFASIFGGEAGIVSPHIVSGTHAIALCLFGLLRPLDCMLCVTGKPYDTLLPTIGINGDFSGSLASFAVSYTQSELLPTGDIDIQKMCDLLAINDKIKLLYIQRSSGYKWRKSLSCEQIREAVCAAKKIKKDLIVMVDNCYGEFCETIEPCHVGADLIAGSLIKNPGGGLAPSGGYIVGRSDLIDLISARLTAPGLNNHVGSNFSGYLPYFQGLFLAPHVTVQALKGATLFSSVFEKLGYECEPKAWDERYSTTQSICFENELNLLKFMHGIQESSPVDSIYSPIPCDMPGYSDDIIMAAGTFISGATSELSADAPVKPPYIAFLQGALTYEHAKYALLNILEKFEEN